MGRGVRREFLLLDEIGVVAIFSVGESRLEFRLRGVKRQTACFWQPTFFFFFFFSPLILHLISRLFAPPEDTNQHVDRHRNSN